MKIALRGGGKYIGLFLIILFLTGAFFYLNRDNHQREMNEYNRRELDILNGLVEKRQFFRDSLKHQMDSVMLQLHKNTDYDAIFRYQTNRRMLQSRMLRCSRMTMPASSLRRCAFKQT